MKAKKLTQTEMNKLGADDLLRAVDRVLLKFGPSRAMAKLGEVWIYMPRGTMSRATNYKEFLEQMLQRHERGLDIDRSGSGADCGKRAAADLRGAKNSHAEVALTKH